MQTEDSIVKIGIVGAPNHTDLSRLTPGQLRVHRTRKILLVLLGILLGFDLIYLVFITHAYVDKSQFSRYFKNHTELLSTLLSVIYDAFGLLVTYQLFRTGLRVFIWIGIISLVLLDFVFGIIRVVSLSTRTSTAVVDDAMIAPFVSLVISVVSSIMLLTIMCLACKLSSRLVKYRAPIIRTV